MSETEMRGLTSGGWDYEGIAWYSDTAQGKPVYRLYNPYDSGASAHMYTTDVDEYQGLHGLGWRQEGVQWYGLS